MALYERNEEGQLVPFEGDVPEEAIQAIERADEQAIVERLTKVEAQPFFAYSYPINTKRGPREIIGISVDGAKEIGRQLGNIKPSTDFKVDERDDYLYCALPVTDLVRNFTWIGVARQSKYILDEGMQPTDRIDETAFVKVVNKAQRNGILGVAPQEAIAQIISKLEPKYIKKLQSPPPTGKLPPAKANDKSEESEIKRLRQQLHLKWDELAKLDPGVGDKKGWLKEIYQCESSTELSLDELRDAIAKVNEMIAERSEPLATDEEKREIARELLNLVEGNTQKEKQQKVTDIFRETTGKKGGWTKQDMEKLRAKIDELKAAAPDADKEAEDFLKDLEG